MCLPCDILLDILQYINPNKLHDLADSGLMWRYIVNSMDKGEYLERWHDISHENDDIYGEYVYPCDFNMKNIQDILVNNWYYELAFKINGNINTLIDTLSNSSSGTLLKKTNRQMLSIYISGIYPTPNIIKILGKIHMLKLINIRGNIDLSYLRNLHSVYLSGYWGKYTPDWSCLASLYSVKISLPIWYDINDIEDLSCLGDIHTLEISNGAYINLNGLDKIHTLNLLCCVNIKDISNLGGVSNINLNGNSNIIDVSYLGSADKITISNSWINDVTFLSAAYSIKLLSCYNITNISSLSGVYSLDLSWCDSITDISNLSAINKLTISECKLITYNYDKHPYYNTNAIVLN